MLFRSLVLTSFLTILCQNSAHAQGLLFAETAEGEVMTTVWGSKSLSIDIFGDAARKIFEQLKADPAAARFSVRNARGENTGVGYGNTQIICTKLLNSENCSCRMKMDGAAFTNQLPQ